MLEAMHARTMMIMNTDLDSPIKNKIVLTGDNKKGKPFTTNTIVTATKKLNPYGRVVKGAHELGDYWLTNSNHDLAMKNSCTFFAEIVIEFLQVFESKCSNWNLDLGKEDGAFLLTNQGISSLFLMMGDLVREYAKSKDLLIKDYSPDTIVSWIEPWLDPVIEFINEASVEQLVSLRKRLGLAGQSEIRYILEGKIHSKFPEFNPPRLQAELEKLSDQWKEKANDLVDEMESVISKHIIQTLKFHYGPTEHEWFRGGVPLEVTKSVMLTSLENNSSVEASFHILDWYKTVASKNNYNDIFKEIYGLAGYPNKGDSGKDKILSWFTLLNDVRKKVKHPVGKVVSEQEYQKLLNVWEKIKPRIDSSFGEMV